MNIIKANMKPPISRFQIVFLLRQIHAWQIAAIGFGIFSISLYIKLYIVNEPWVFITELFYRTGESLIVVGLIGYILEHHTISKYVTEEMTGSILDDIFKNYFSRDQMKDFITKFILYYNKYEHIEPDVESLLQEHGIPEMTDKPRKENVKLTVEYAGEIEESEGLIYIKKSHYYRAFNAAKKLPHVDYKFLNKSGMIYGTTTLFHEGLFDKSNIEPSIKKHFQISFKLRPSFSNGEVKADKWHKVENIICRQECKFDLNKCKARETTSLPKLYLVYNILSDERVDGKDYLEVSLYSNIAIPPQEHVDIEISVTQPSQDSDIVQHNIISYIHNLSYELKFDETVFKTGVDENIIGKGRGLSEKSAKGFRYTGWILPHSSLSCFWSRIKASQKEK